MWLMRSNLLAVVKDCAEGRDIEAAADCRRTLDMLYVADIIFAVVFLVEMVLLVSNLVWYRMVSSCF